MKREKFEKIEDFADNHAIYGFYFGIEIMIAFINMYLLCLNHMLITFIYTIYLIGIGFLTFVKYELIASDIMLYSFIYACAGVIANYVKIRNSKISFYNEKQLKRLNEEQYLIFNTLPDGALIHQQINAIDREKMTFNMIASE